MSNKPRRKGLLDKKLDNTDYRKLQTERYEAFKLEVQLLNALERKGWTYTDLAKATNTYKSNISRDLKGGRIFAATFSRINKIAEALGMKLVALLIPAEHEDFILPRIEELVRASFNILSSGIGFSAESPSAANWSNTAAARNSNTTITLNSPATEGVTPRLSVQGV